VEGFDVGDFGFEIDYLPQVVMPTDRQGEGEDKPQTEVKEDDFDPDEVHESKVHRGEVWQLGEHRLMCGDSTDADAVAKLMNGEQADGVLTDPPFGNDLGYGRGQLGERYIANDSDTKVLSSFFAPLDSVLKNNTHCLVWIQWRTFSTLEKAFEKYKLRTVVIWDKMQPGLSGGGFAEQYEMMCVFIKGHATQNEYCGNVWQISREHDKRSESEHPHKKPIALLGKALNLCSHEGDIILDLFGGSGSTMIACEQLGRKCRMMELDPHYCTVIIARWEKLTGQKAVKL
jgi:DNA modification methylase